MFVISYDSKYRAHEFGVSSVIVMNAVVMYALLS
jgi:hypothetical protein